MDKKEFVKILRKELKNKYPNCKFSIHESFGIMNVLLLSSDINPYSEGYGDKRLYMSSYMDRKSERIPRIEKNPCLNDFSKVMFKFITNYMEEHYDYSYSIGIGSYCTEFRLKK